MVPTEETLMVLRRIGLFLIGGVILFIEIEFMADARGWVIGLALVLMGVVTIEQIVEWAQHRKP